MKRRTMAREVQCKYGDGNTSSSVLIIVILVPVQSNDTQEKGKGGIAQVVQARTPANKAKRQQAISDGFAPTDTVGLPDKRDIG
jgi:hypothetical protein